MISFESDPQVHSTSVRGLLRLKTLSVAYKTMLLRANMLTQPAKWQKKQTNKNFAGEIPRAPSSDLKIIGLHYLLHKPLMVPLHLFNPYCLWKFSTITVETFCFVAPAVLNIDT